MLMWGTRWVIDWDFVGCSSRGETAISGAGSEDALEPGENSFSQVEYWIFLLMGVAMLWAW